MRDGWQLLVGFVEGGMSSWPICGLEGYGGMKTINVCPFTRFDLDVRTQGFEVLQLYKLVMQLLPRTFYANQLPVDRNLVGCHASVSRQRFR